MKPRRLEVILSVYRAERELREVLEGYLRQVETDFSIVLADDGSGPGVERIASEFADRGLRIRHMWQEDRGFRKCRILNRAVATSSADYLLLSDGDCIPSRHFVRDHLEWAEPGRYVCGRRVMLGEEVSNAILLGELNPFEYENPIRLVAGEARGQLRHAWCGVRPPRPIADLMSSRPRSLAGCNAAVWMTDLVRINGFNNAFEGWGYEDSELEARLAAASVRSKALRGRGVLFHLHHQSNFIRTNEDLLYLEQERSPVEAVSGLRETIAECVVLDDPA